MSNKYGLRYTDAFQSIPSVKNDVTDMHGKVRQIFDSYVQPAAALSIGDKIYLGRLPKGAKIVDALLQSSDFGATGVIDVGFEYVAREGDIPAGVVPAGSLSNGLFSGVDIHTAAAMNKMSAAAAPGAFMLELASDADIVAVVTTATDATGGSLALVVQYVIE